MFWRLKERGLVWVPSFPDPEDIREQYFSSSLDLYLMVDRKGQVRFTYDGMRYIRKWAPQPGSEPVGDDYLPNEPAIKFSFEALKWEGMNSGIPDHLQSYTPMTIAPFFLVSQVRASATATVQVILNCQCRFHGDGRGIVHIDTTGCHQHGSKKGRSVKQTPLTRSELVARPHRASMRSARRSNLVVSLPSDSDIVEPAQRSNRRCGTKTLQALLQTSEFLSSNCSFDHQAGESPVRRFEELKDQ